MTNDDPMYVRQLEAALDAAEIEIKALEDELKRCHEIISEQQNDLNPTHMGEPNNPGDFPENRVMLYTQPNTTTPSAALAKIKADTLREFIRVMSEIEPHHTSYAVRIAAKMAAEIEGVAK